MAVRNILVHAPPAAVWSVLEDGRSYAKWVVGTREIRDVDAGWPAEGSSLHYTVGVGPVRLEDRTTVRICERERRLELEALAAPYGSVRISVQLLPWGEGTVVVMDEHPLRGPSLLFENPVSEMFLTLRARRMLRHLARLVQEQRGPAST